MPTRKYPPFPSPGLHQGVQGLLYADGANEYSADRISLCTIRLDSYNTSIYTYMYIRCLYRYPLFSSPGLHQGVQGLRWLSKIGFRWPHLPIFNHLYIDILFSHRRPTPRCARHTSRWWKKLLSRWPHLPIFNTPISIKYVYIYLYMYIICLEISRYSE